MSEVILKETVNRPFTLARELTLRLSLKDRSSSHGELWPPVLWHCLQSVDIVLYTFFGVLIFCVVFLNTNRV